MAINEKKAYAAYYDNDIRMKSSSGAIFSLLANEVLEKKGIVYGVAMNASCTEAEYIGITEKQDLEKLLGSKYLQAKIKNIFKNVRENLVLNRLVLFTGTGCQINGLKKFLQKDYKNLICVDIICHGVPSPALWKEYVGYMENKMQGKMEKVNFRCKDQGWENFGMKEYGSSKEVYISKSKDPYMQMFLSDFCLRPSCYECKAKTLRLLYHLIFFLHFFSFLLITSLLSTLDSLIKNLHQIFIMCLWCKSTFKPFSTSLPHLFNQGIII